MIRKLLYIGRLFSPTIALHASQAATICSDLLSHHLWALNATLSTIKNCLCIITYLPSNGQSFKLEAMSDASIQTWDKRTNVREGIILFWKSYNIVHAIRWIKRLARRVARSTSTAELLADADAFERITYFKHLFEENEDKQTTELVLDSRSTTYPWSIMKEPEEVKKTLLLASIR